MGRKSSVCGDNPSYTAYVVNHVGKKTTQKLGILEPFHNMKSNLSVRNGGLLYEEHKSSLMEYERPVWRFAARSHDKKLQVLQSKYPRIATNAP
jgi:hypothetical protein